MRGTGRRTRCPRCQHDGKEVLPVRRAEAAPGLLLASDDGGWPPGQVQALREGGCTRLVPTDDRGAQGVREGTRTYRTWPRAFTGRSASCPSTLPRESTRLGGRWGRDPPREAGAAAVRGARLRRYGSGASRGLLQAPRRTLALLPPSSRGPRSAGRARRRDASRLTGRSPPDTAPAGGPTGWWRARIDVSGFGVWRRTAASRIGLPSRAPTCALRSRTRDVIGASFGVAGRDERPGTALPRPYRTSARATVRRGGWRRRTGSGRATATRPAARTGAEDARAMNPTIRGDETEVPALLKLRATAPIRGPRSKSTPRRRPRSLPVRQFR